jgi:hypothetical protein
MYCTAEHWSQGHCTTSWRTKLRQLTVSMRNAGRGNTGFGHFDVEGERETRSVELAWGCSFTLPVYSTRVI